MKKLLFTLIFYFIAATTTAQYCACISDIIDKKDSTEIKSGATKSNDSYSLLIQKERKNGNLNNEPTYFLSLNATSRDMFSNSFTNNKGKIELFLKDKSKIVLENAKCLYNPVASGFSVTFGAVITKEQLEILLVNPIATFSALGMVKTSFSEKKQREQQIIISCLLNM
jgi:hypothetical protein